jgi:ATP:ADP antiporter, AAA family
VTSSILQNITKIKSSEVRAVALSFAFIFSNLAAYYIIRNVRDSFASEWSDAEVSTIWTFTFFISFIVVSFYGYICSKIPFRYLVPCIYGFFSLTFFSLYGMLNLYPDSILIPKAFYVWVSVFSLLNISVFWSFMADIFSKEQSKRIFGFIAAGSSLGAIIGPLITLLFVKKIGSLSLIIVSSSMLFIPLLISLLLGRLSNPNQGSEILINDKAMGGNFWDGFREVFKPPLGKNLLFGIGIFIMLYTGMGTILYFFIKNMLTEVDQDTRTQIWARIDLYVNLTTVLIAMFGTSRLIKNFGLTVTLPFIPLIMVFGMLVLALSPILTTVLVIQIARRIGEYAITKPSREMLFTIMDRNERFKGKSVIDVVFYRAGDIIWAWSYTGLTIAGLGFASIALVGTSIALVWTFLGYRLGKNFDKE